MDHGILTQPPDQIKAPTQCGERRQKLEAGLGQCHHDSPNVNGANAPPRRPA
jgi:hypothetical protein